MDAPNFRFRLLLFVINVIMAADFLADANQGSCDQVLSSEVSKSGNLTSPGYPSPYPARINCKYTFLGRKNERIQIIFTDFDLYKPFEDTKDCDGVDAVVAFVYINGQPDRIDNYCGKQMPTQLMSNGASMYLEFHSYQSSSMSRGFRAIYKFVSDFGISSGRQDDPAVCGFVFNSSEAANGTISSPNFPGYYPRNTECQYLFRGKKKERVRIKFTAFNVEGVLPCTVGSASDYVEFSNFPSTDRKIPRHCGLRLPAPIESERNYFRITFRTNHRFDATGFQATYQFVNATEGNAIIRVPLKSNGNTFSIGRSEQMVALLILSVCCYILLGIYR